MSRAAIPAPPIAVDVAVILTAPATQRGIMRDAGLTDDDP